MIGTLHFLSGYDLITNSVELLAEEVTARGPTRRVVLPLTVTVADVTQNQRIEPTLRLNMDDARSLMDALWHAGVRPSALRDQSGEIGAMREHLHDLRRLVFKDFPAEERRR